MPGFTKNDDRYIVPRWRSFRDTVRTRELDFSEPVSATTHRAVSADFLADRLAEWEAHQTVGHASDLVGAGVALGRPAEVLEAARFLLDQELSVSPWARELARNALGYPEDDVGEIPQDPTRFAQIAYAQVRSLRRMLRLEPNDPIVWVELARTYATLSHRDHARRCIRCALQLAKNNRFVLRSATRFLLHEEDADTAHSILLEAEATPFDPWLIAAEVAVGSIRNGRPKLVKSARRMLADTSVSESQITELASAMATLELESGNFRKSKKLFRRSLRGPTENSMAQAVWATRKGIVLDISNEFESVSNSYEARTLHSTHTGSWNDCIVPCRSWHYYQPFSRRPSIQGSFVASTALGDFRSGMEFAKMGLKANPNDFILLNNFAFAAAQCGMIDEAERKLEKASKLSPSGMDSAVLKATAGLVSFRKGEFDAGRKLYLDARSSIKSLDSNERDKLDALAATFHALEEFRANSGEGDKVCAAALDALRLVNDPIGVTLRDRLNSIQKERSNHESSTVSTASHR